MQITSLTVGPVATCCYILSREGGKDCIVIDPGAEAEADRKDRWKNYSRNETQ